MSAKFQHVYKKVIALAFFVAILSIAGLASYTYADNYSLSQSTGSGVHDWKSIKYSDSYMYAISSYIGDSSVYYSGDGSNWYAGPNALLDPSSKSITGVTSSSNGQYVAISSTEGISINTNYVFGNWDTSWQVYGMPFYSIAMSSDGSSIIAGSDNYIYRTSNYGSSWTPIYMGAGRVVSVACNNTCTTIFAVMDSGSLFRSLDGGNGWSIINNISGNSYSIAASNDGSHVLVAGSSYPQVSEDSGASWTSHTETGNTGWSSAAVSPNGTRMFIAPLSGYPWSSVDGGRTWSQDSSVYLSNFGGVAFSSNGNAVVGASSNSYIYYGNRIISAPGTPDLAASSDTGYSDSDDITNANSFTFTVSCTNEGDTVTLYDAQNNSNITSTVCSTGSATLSMSPGSTGDTTLYFNADEGDGSLTSSKSGTIAVTIDRTPPVITSLSSGNMTDSSAQIFISTDEVTPSASVSLPITAGLYSDSSYATSHDVYITGLSSGTQYAYDTSVTDIAGNVGSTNGGYSFTTENPPMAGCTDSLANNYNSSASISDGSCVYNEGCTDSSANNYDSNATHNNGSCTYPVYGCTGSGANNYNPNANVDDGSCDYNISGCKDLNANNYNVSASVDDGSCTYYEGCMDSNAINYDSSASHDNGSCIYVVYGCTDSTANNYSSGANTNDNSCTYDTYGCTDSTANNYNSSANIENNSCTYDTVGCTDSSAVNYNSSANVSDGSCVYVPSSPGTPVLNPFDDHGDSNSDNLTNATTLRLSVSCENGDTVTLYDENGTSLGTTACWGSEAGYSISNPSDSSAWSNMTHTYYATQDNMYGTSAVSASLAVTLDTTAPDYTFSNPPQSSAVIGIVTVSANVYDASGISSVQYSFDGGSGNQAIDTLYSSPYDTNWDTNSLSEGPYDLYAQVVDIAGNSVTSSPYRVNVSSSPVLGCMDASANNWNTSATVDDGSCTYDIGGCLDGAANNYNPDAVYDDGSCTYYEGCTDSTASNYDSSATHDDGSCAYDVYGCMTPSDNNYNPAATIDDGSCGEGPHAGCTDGNANNYDQFATSDDGSCTYDPIFGCTDSNANNWDPSADTDNGSCTYDPVVPGCTDSSASNYDSSATEDDGSCEYSYAACTDSQAANYDPGASSDDGSCVYLLAEPHTPHLVASSDTGVSSADLITSDTTPTFTVSGCDSVNSTSVDLYDDYGSIGSGTCSAGTATITSSVLAGGVHNIYATQSSTAGESAPTLTAGVDIRTVGPVVSEVGNDSFATSASVNWNTDVPANGKIQYGLNTSYGSSAQSLSSYEIENHQLTLSNLVANTIYHFRIISVDEAGLTSTSTDYSLTTVVAPPGTPTLTSGTDSGLLGDGITKLAAPYLDISCVNGATVQLSINGTPDNSAYCVNGSALIVPSYDLPEDSYSMTANQTYGGNTSSDSGSLSLIIDTTGPAQSDVHAYFIATSTAAVYVGANEDATGYVEYGDDNMYASTSYSNGGDYVSTHTVYLSGLQPETQYNYHLISTDRAGNTTQSGDDTFMTEAVTDNDGGGGGNGDGDGGPSSAPNPPNTPILDSASDTGTSNSDGITSDTTPTIYGAGVESSAVVGIYLDGTLIGNATADTNGNWAYTVSALPNGSYTFTVTQTANNRESSGSAGLSITIDTSITNVSGTSTPPVTSSGGFSSTQTTGGQDTSGGAIVSGSNNSSGTGGSNNSSGGIISSIADLLKGVYNALTGNDAKATSTATVVPNTGDKDKADGTSAADASNATPANGDAKSSDSKSGIFAQKQLFVLPTGAAYQFARNLAVGSVGSAGISGAALGSASSQNTDVKKLQVFLNSTGYLVASKGAGSTGLETNTFGPATKAAVLKFQKAVGIKGANGMFGPATRAYINNALKGLVK